MARLRLGLRVAVALFISVLFVLPLLWMVANSVGRIGAPPPVSFSGWPEDPQWSNYRTLFDMLPMWRYLRNSLLVVALAVPLTLLTASLAGFGMAQLPDAGRRRALIYFSLAVLMIPGASVWLFRFQILRWLGLLDSIWALVAPAFAASNPLFVLLFYWNFRRAPAELFQAARLDGASAWTTWWRVAMPLARPTILAVTVLSFVLYWSDFVSPVLYIFDTDWYTLPVGLQILKQLDATNWPLLMVGAVVMTLPVVVLFALLQRFFLSEASIANWLEE